MFLSWMIYSFIKMSSSRMIEKGGLDDNLKELNLTEDC